MSSSNYVRSSVSEIMLKTEVVFCNFIKKGLWYRCFHVNFAKFLRTPFYIEYIRWLLLHRGNLEFLISKSYRHSKVFCTISCFEGSLILVNSLQKFIKSQHSIWWVTSKIRFWLNNRGSTTFFGAWDQKGQFLGQFCRMRFEFYLKLKRPVDRLS